MIAVADLFVPTCLLGRRSCERRRGSPSRSLDSARPLAQTAHGPFAQLAEQRTFNRMVRRTRHHVRAHRLRHTFATWPIESQARELDVQYLLGHSPSAMVQRYAATYDSAKAAAAHGAFSPVGRLPAT